MRIAMLVISILIAQGAGLLGVFFMGDSLSSWYLELSKPSWNPPAFVFGPVWTVLYTLMGIAAYLVWRTPKEHVYRSRALVLYGVQLGLNALWTPFFFGLQNPALALMDIGLLLLCIVMTIVYFFKVKQSAALLLFPYLAWVVFATFLNLSIVMLNS